MKKILILVHSGKKRPGDLDWFGFRDLVAGRVGDNISVQMTSLGRLTFLLDGDMTLIRDYSQGFDVADFDLVVLRTVGNRREKAAAVAAYCRKKGIPYIDPYLPTTGCLKLGSAFMFWEHDLPVPITASGPPIGMKEAVKVTGLPAIFKANGGMRGQDNYVVKSFDDIQEHMSVPAAPHYLLQQFIPNDGDYRIMVLNNRPVMAMKRTASKGSHLNNTSRGATASLVDLESLSAEVIDLALQATSVEKLAIAGADIIIDKETGKPYILEVNREPQLATGGFADEKMHFYVQALKEILNGDVDPLIQNIDKVRVS